MFENFSLLSYIFFDIFPILPEIPGSCLFLHNMYGCEHIRSNRIIKSQTSLCWKGTLQVI